MAPAVEFLDIAISGGDDPEEEPRRLRWWRVLTVVAGVALIAALLGHPLIAQRRAVPSPSRPPPSLAFPMPPADPFGSGNIALAYGGGRLFGLSTSRLGVLNPTQSGPAARRSRHIPLDPASQDGFGLVWDSRGAAVWVVPLFGRQPGVLREYGTDLRLRRTVALPDIAHAATVLDGGLYVSTNVGILRIGSSDTPTLLPLAHRSFERSRSADDFDPYGSLGAVVADPARSRLLYLEYGSTTYLATWSLSTGRSSSAALSMPNATLAVIGRTIWETGLRRGRAVLQRLDPITFRPERASDAGARVGAGATIVGEGRSSVFARTDVDANALWCLDAATGVIRQHWSGPAGEVRGAGRTLFALASSRLVRLPVGGCPG